jgi:hypothetical protein
LSRGHRREEASPGVEGFGCGWRGGDGLSSLRENARVECIAVALRDVEESDLVTFYEHQMDPVATEMVDYAAHD